MIAILNALFEAQAAEIRGHGGEILKFIGDGLLAIFPIAETEAVATVARTAVAAAIMRSPQSPVLRAIPRWTASLRSTLS